MVNQQNRKELGQGLVEYALIIVLLAIVVIVGLTLLGTGITDAYSNIISNL
jgi:pilus assembly protein Flp/PilA